MKEISKKMQIYMKMIGAHRKRNKKQEKGKMSQKRGNRIKRETTDRIIEKLINEIEEEESKDNVQHTDTESLAEQATEIIIGYGIQKEQEALLKLCWYNYA